VVLDPLAQAEQVGAPFAPLASCAFAVGRWDVFGPLSVYLHGTAEYPDRSATLIAEVETLTPNGATLQGPGIHGQASLSLPEIAPFQHNAAQFPLGVDFFFTCGAQIAGLPRSTKVTG
jgi:alpha-D-ribose 1-methylphosphonate 5-triphosphate synthase subunit PhnH